MTPAAHSSTIDRLGLIDAGESAVRVLTAVSGLNNASDAPPITTVLFHDDPDPEPWYGREADEVRRLSEVADGLSHDDVAACLGAAQIDTVWLGTGSACDRADLIAACEAVGIGVVGPGSSTVRTLATPTAFAAIADAMNTALAATGSALVAPTRRVEVDVLADRYGTVWTLGGRDVSVQREGRPLMAEAPCAAIGDELAARIREAAEQLVRGVEYRGAGVVTFVHDGANLELDGFDCVASPDHATTEERTGASVIGWRLRIHRGEALAGEEPAGDGIVIEARVLADDPEGTAAPGRIALLSLPIGTGVRIDANRRVGDIVDPNDPLLAVVTAWGPDRAVALSRARRALERTTIVIDGGVCNRTLLLRLLDHDDVIRDHLDDGWFERVFARADAGPPHPVALLAAAVQAYEDDRRHAQREFYASAGRGRPQAPVDVGDGIELGYAGSSHRLDVDRVGPKGYSIRADSDVADITVDALDDYERRITCGGHRYRLTIAPYDTGYVVEMGSTTHRVAREDGLVVRAQWPALVVQPLVEPGDVVLAGDPIVVVESMKMETTVTAPTAGQVVTVPITPNAQVERGAALIRIRPTSVSSSNAVGSPSELDLTGMKQQLDPTRKPCDRVYEPLGNYLLGYDLSPAALQRLLVQQRRLGEIADPADAALIECEDHLFDIYAELGALYRPQMGGDTDELAVSSENTQEYLISFLQWLDADRAGLPSAYRQRLLDALARFGVRSLDRTPELESALMWLFRSFGRLGELSPVVLAILERRLAYRNELADQATAEMRARLDRLASSAQGRQQPIADLARDVRFHYFDEPPITAAATELYAEMRGHLDALGADPQRADRDERLDRLVWCPLPMRPLLLEAWGAGADVPHEAARRIILETNIRRMYRIYDLGEITFHHAERFQFAVASYRADGDGQVVAGYLPLEALPEWTAAVTGHLAAELGPSPVLLDVVAWRTGEQPDIDTAAAEAMELAAVCELPDTLERLDLTIASSTGAQEEHHRVQHVSLRRDGDRLVEDVLYRNLHPMLAERLEIWRLSNFELERRPSPEDIYLFHGVARSNAKDHRLFALAEVRDLLATTDPDTGEVSYPRLERMALLAFAAMRTELTRDAPRDRPVANRMVLDVPAPWTLSPGDLEALAARFAPLAARVGLEKVVVKVRVRDDTDELREAVLHIENVGNRALIREDRAGDRPVRPLGVYQQKVLTAARFGSPYPHEIVRLLTEHTAHNGLPADSFQELELDADDRLVPVDREPGTNIAHVVIGLITNHTVVVPEGMQRVVILSDPTQGLGNLAEPECRRINAALAYALENQLPVEWFAVSSGALIAMDSGTENMDWIALTLRRLIEFTQAGGAVNIVVTGINVGGQPYWNAEATMLTHTKGILVMTPASAMVLTGKQALDFSGAVSAEDNFGIGGYDRVMGPNGQAQYWAPSFPDACALLLRHYELTYVVPGERFPRRHPTDDPISRDVRSSPHAEMATSPFTTVGDVFSPELNGDRKQPFDMRSVMRAVADVDADVLERWEDLRDGDTSIVWDTTIGGIPVCMLGIESHTVGRKGFVPSDGPPAWTSGTLFPHASRKTARSINAASANRPLVVLANLSGFDGSPESMRRRQLEFGAEIGRAVTNFDGPIVFVVVSRYHGGAFVVFSKALNSSMEIAAVEGSFASVIGGAPAAATVFAREVKQRTEQDPRIRDARAELAAADGPDAARLRAALAAVTERVRSEMLGVVADEFDGIHTIERALRVGSVDRIIAAADIRPYIVDALERGIARHS